MLLHLIVNIINISKPNIYIKLISGCNDLFMINNIKFYKKLHKDLYIKRNKKRRFRIIRHGYTEYYPDLDSSLPPEFLKQNYILYLYYTELDNKIYLKDNMLIITFCKDFTDKYILDTIYEINDNQKDKSKITYKYIDTVNYSRNEIVYGYYENGEMLKSKFIRRCIASGPNDKDLIFIFKKRYQDDIIYLSWFKNNKDKLYIDTTYLTIDLLNRKFIIK